LIGDIDDDEEENFRGSEPDADNFEDMEAEDDDGELPEDAAETEEESYGYTSDLEDAFLEIDVSTTEKSGAADQDQDDSAIVIDSSLLDGHDHIPEGSEAAEQDIHDHSEDIEDALLDISGGGSEESKAADGEIDSLAENVNSVAEDQTGE
jgi:hypothetical protein